MTPTTITPIVMFLDIPNNPPPLGDLVFFAAFADTFFADTFFADTFDEAFFAARLFAMYIWLWGGAWGAAVALLSGEVLLYS
jgi:hypothetical protein